ncbi:MAG: transposase [Gammaproteobacteria bacterium]|nr:transposase [Gammaproteobacteria bacterium]
MTPPFKAYPTEYSQSTLLPANVFDLLPEDHDCFVFQELFQQLDTREVEATYRPRGQRAYPPRQIISILVYAYSHGVYSSRQIEKRCNEDLGFMYIAGMNCPNFRVLSDFRKDHGGCFKDCFRQTVRLAMELELVSLGPVMDGSKFKANTSKHKAMSYQGLKEREQQLCEEIGSLLEQAARCDEKEDAQYRERTGYELPDALQYKEGRLEKILAAKAAGCARNPQNGS